MIIKVKKFLDNKRIHLICIGCLFVMLLSFRLVPFLFPVQKGDLNDCAFQSVKFYDRHGNLLQEVLSENEAKSIHIPVDKVSPYFINAIIATEDKRFYEHHGVDYTAIFRALRQNLVSRRIVSGASTITMQLARMMNPGSRTIFKKIMEMFQAYRLEAGMHKNDILDAYINRLPMGGNLYGIESGAQCYFGISSSDLTLAQASFLASIPNSPNRLNPYHHLEEIKKRQKIVLERMVEQNFISGHRIEGVLKEDVCLKPQTSSFTAPHFVFYLMDKLPEGIHEVKTTIDCDLQKMVQEQINGVLFHLKRFHVMNAAAILIDNHTGDVLAYVGSADYFNVQNEGENDGIQALRQPGSTLKPFLYSLAMEHGFNPATVIPDIPTCYRMPVGIYKPKNYSELFRGPVRLREALANSLNVPAVRVLAKIGIQPFLDYLHEFGFYSLDRDADHYGVGLVLGNGEVTLYELARAYLCLARRGRYTPVREIIDINGIPQNLSVSDRRISTSQINYLITDILSDKFARTAEFGFHTVLNLPFPCAVKTGTSFRFCDNWTMGYTEDYTLGVWVGNFDHTPMQKVSGISGAGPIFSNVMQMLYFGKSYPEKPSVPDGLVQVNVCPLSGKKPNASCPCVMEEWIPVTDYSEYQKSQCDLHIRAKEDVHAKFPVQYRSWAKQLGLKHEESRNEKKNLFSIENPKDGSIYYRLSNLSPEYQSIEINAYSSNSKERINWILNGRPLRSTENPHSFLWQIKPGRYNLMAVSVSDTTLKSAVSFIVK